MPPKHRSRPCLAGEIRSAKHG